MAKILVYLTPLSFPHMDPSQVLARCLGLYHTRTSCQVEPSKRQGPSIHAHHHVDRYSALKEQRKLRY